MIGNPGRRPRAPRPPPRRGTGCARLRIAAVAVGAQIGSRPEEFVEQVAVCAVQFDGVESDVASVAGGRRVGPGNAGQLLGAQCPPLGSPRLFTPDGLTGTTPSGVAPLGALMPQLRGDRATVTVHRPGDRPPSGQYVVACKGRDAARPARFGLRQPDPLGDDQADAACRAARVVLRRRPRPVSRPATPAASWVPSRTGCAMSTTAAAWARTVRPRARRTAWTFFNAVLPASIPSLLEERGRRPPPVGRRRGSGPSENTAPNGAFQKAPVRGVHGPT